MNRIVFQATNQYLLCKKKRPKMPEHYTHNIDPYIFKFPFKLDFLPIEGIPWYGTMYLLGFLFAYLLLEHLRKSNFISLKDKVASQEFINYSVYGVIIGGRLGHFLFYQPEIFFTDPLEILKVWHGGMASHGGMIGVIVAMWLYARKYKINMWRLWDSAAMITIPGLGLGRLGNFINGEMPGKVSDVAWAVIFPDHGSVPRHPSQIYQALGEGLFMFIILWFVLPRNKFKEGFHLSMFLIFYGIQRIVTESYREVSDSLSSFTDLLTQGQILSIGMIFVGIGIFVVTQRKKESVI